MSQPRGIRDIEPEEHALHQRIRRTFEELARAYDFRSMEPAPLETLSILRAKSGAQVDDEIYHFRDKANREIGLRFDLTVGMTRYVAAKKGLRPPIKLASYGGVWRYDEPQHARYRWFYQWDIEIFGDKNVEADAEVMDLSYNLFRRLGLTRVTLEVGDRHVVEEYIRNSLDVSSEERLVELMRALDKVSKKSEGELVKEYQAKGFDAAQVKRLLEFGRTRGTPERVLKRLEEEHIERASELGELKDTLKMRGISNVEYNLSVVRGIDYYTGIVFEVTDGAHPDLGSLCGGGRYDILPAVFGRPELAATGSAGGVERIALSLAGPREKAGPSAYVAYTEPALAHEAIRLLTSLREAGVRSELGARGKKLSRQLEDSAARGFTHTVIVGRKELDAGVVILREMATRKEEIVTPEDLVTHLSSS